MSEAAQRVTYARYVAMAEASERKLEYDAGEVRAMAGGTIEHGRLMVGVSTALSIALRGKPCVVLSSDVRVRIRAADRATYPDVTVVCGKIEHDADDKLAVTNPKVIVEVSSDSTDRTDEFADYRSARIEVYRRDGKRWTLDEYGRGERAQLESLGIQIAVDDVYFDPRAPERSTAHAGSGTCHSVSWRSRARPSEASSSMPLIRSGPVRGPSVSPRVACWCYLGAAGDSRDGRTA